MDPLQIFDNFKLGTLDAKWSDEVWEREFLTFPEAPLEYAITLESEDMEQFLRETCSTLKQWMAQNREKDETNSEERPEVSWQTITALDINIRGLLAVLGYLMKAGQATAADEDTRQACLAATSLYFVLLSIPGSSTFHVFHPNLYHRAIETLKLSELLVVCKRKVSEFEAAYGDRHEEMSTGEKNTLIKGLNSILYELITMLKSFYMKYQLSSLEVTVINLVEVTKLETEVNHFAVNHNRRKDGRDASVTTLAYNAYAALQDLIEPRHGAEDVTIKLIMKYLMPHLCPHYLDLPVRAANVVWDTTICFLRNILQSKGSCADRGMEILLQHLLINSPDRSEPRQKQASVVARLINVCQGKLFLNCVKNLVFFSFHNKIPYRIFGQEVISKLLLAELSLECEAEAEVENRKKAKVALIATAQSRSIDVSSMVRGKSLSTIESLVNSENFSVGDFLNMTEENQSFPMPDVILKSLFDDTNPLPGSNTFTSMLLERIRDERALVRRSTLHVLQHLVIHFSGLLDRVTPIIGQHCRDPALSVRRDAVLALACLLQANPLNKSLLSEYIKSVLPRIHDVEIKVQERVLESLQNIVLDNINAFSDEDEEDQALNELPWSMLRELTRAKMRKNLSKICEHWVKNKVVSDSTIARIQSHVGTAHDEESWVLLLALAESMALPNMQKYFEDTKELLESDTFVSILKLGVLKYIWPTMDDKYLESLSKQCFDCLIKFHVPIESIGTCIDILDGITKRLHKDNEDGDLMHTQMVNLMRLSEAQIDRLDDEDEEVDDDNILTFLKAMSTLGHSSLLCSEDVTQSTLGIVQSLLLDVEGTIKMAEEHLQRFKAAGVVLLGQQALRDRDIAEQVVPILGRLMNGPASSAGEASSRCTESLGQSAIRVNAVKALADLCIRFTALVEPYLPNMCVTMKDPNSMVRETIVVIFVQLLLEDYIKVKGAFFYHILTMLSDADETIRELTIFLIKERLLAKNKLLISQSFVKAIFHYNNCQLRHKFNERKIRKREREILLLPGKTNESKRRVIYDFMLEHLDPPSKLKILTKLNSEIFEGTCEKLLDIGQDESVCVFKDACYIIANDRMQASFGSRIQDDEVHEDVATVLETQTNNALNVIAEGMKKFKFNVMTQSLIRLRRFLTEEKSPLLKDASKLFSKIISELNKDQLTELLDEYPDLKKDIDRDISRFAAMDDSSGDSDASEEEIEKKSHSITDMSSVIEQHESSITTTPSKKKIKESSATPEKLPETPRKSMPRKIHEVHLTNMPRIVLRRLSALTYPGVKAWKSPPHDTAKLVYQSSDPEPSSSGISVSSRSASDDMNLSPLVDDLSEPELTSPKPSKIARLAESIADVQIS